MKLRSVIALTLTTTMLAATARAQSVGAAPVTIACVPVESTAPGASLASAAPDVLRLTSAVLAPRMALPRQPRVALLSPRAPTDIRLSQGAKTAIIVGAIVVGVLIIVGVVAIGKPGKHL